MGAQGEHRQASVAAKIRPAPTAAVDVVRLEPHLIQKDCEGDVRIAARETPQLRDLRRPLGGDGLADVCEHALLCDGVQLQLAARRKERETTLDLIYEVLAAAAEQRPEAQVESELLPVLADEVQNSAHCLAAAEAQSAAELLKEQRGAIGGTQEEHGVNDGHVDPFVEEVHGKHNVHAPLGEVRQRAATFLFRAVSPHGGGSEARLPEHARHEARMGDAYAEAERAHPTRVIDVLYKLLDDQ